MTARKLFEMETADGQKAELYENAGGTLEIHVDGVWGAMYSQSGTCKFNFFTISPTPDKGTERREVAVRLAMTAQTVVALRDYLNKQITNLQERGILVIEHITPPADVPAKIRETKPRKTTQRKKKPK